MDIYDFEPAARPVAQLLDAVRDDQLDDPTPCPDYAVREILGHLVGLTAAFRNAADKDFGPLTGTNPGSALPTLDGDWRTTLPRQLDELVVAWRSPAAWEGDTQAGGITFPAVAAAQVAVDELVVHGWDLARATGQPYEPDTACLKIAEAMLGAGPERRGEIFGPVIEVPEGAPLLDRVIGLSGRNPDWKP
ncbi:TIGR03086 family metal-binding protein [Streptomyces beijiangensis]|uniref:TIGR03086 family protein n=1 Tax=Streptomyces beijiangensis TaxID=163361 RepID=A0A939FBE3_9ACTN|nr:TIGR03086 family metal-binding protein [Streptomyces beijiangensis]MBO0515064.1 TIGR03086 family protein [Streptomyces beijiangensis]